MKISSRTSQQGFSLVEVTIAMAIAAVGMVSILGLLPQGLSTMRAAGDKAIEARIHQQILNELQMTPFGGASSSPLDKFQEMEIYYDSQGEELGDSEGGGVSGAAGSFEHVYTARVNVPRQGQNVPDTVGGSTFGGVTFAEGETENQYLRPVIIEIAAVGGQGENFDWDLEDNRRSISVYQTYVADMGKDFSKN